MVAPIHPSVRPFVCFPGRAVRPSILIFGIGIDHSTLTQNRLGVVGQGCRSMVKVKCQNRLLTSLLACFKFEVKGQGQRSGQGYESRSKVRSWVKVKGQGRISGVQWSILGAWLCLYWCNKEQRRVTLSSRCLSVCLMQSIGFYFFFTLVTPYS